MPDTGTTPIRGLSCEELEQLLEDELGERRFRGRQIFRWLHHRNARSFDEMTDLGRGLRERLARLLEPSSASLLEQHRASDGTRKLALELRDGAVVETVLIPGRERLTLCVSSQVGCALRCSFCRTGTMGLLRNLQTDEIVEQVAWARRLVDEESGRISNLVFMGMGEPLHNYEPVLRSLRLLLDPKGADFSRRRITVSTAGVVPGIERLGREQGLGVNLAVSLNACSDQLRDELMPVNRKWNLARLFEALRAYPLQRRQRITFEYVMLAGVNDSLKDARQLVRLLHGVPSKVNLIGWNQVPGMAFAGSTPEVIQEFRDFLAQRHMAVSIRESRGQDALAACGQLGRTGKACLGEDGTPQA